MENKAVKEPVLVIMAAGMGSRYGGLKQIDPISDQGEVILDFSLYDAVMAGFKKVIFVIKKEIEEDFKALVQGKSDKYIDVEYAFQAIDDLPEGFEVPEGRTKPWGTCHAVLACRDMIDGPFAVINADDYYGAGAFQTIYDCLVDLEDDPDCYNYAMVNYRIENTLTENGYVARGVCEDDGNGYLKEVNERTKIMQKGSVIIYVEEALNKDGTPAGDKFVKVERGTPVSMNFWGFTRSFIDELEKRFPSFLEDALKNNPLKGEYYLPLAVQQLLSEGKARVKMLESHDKWYGVTYHEDKEDVVNAMQSLKDKGFYPEKLWK
ncbi:MAG: nucleotidyltransferase [Firmicutes bacterium]|nr:nucleotidyltransferase [Bacillota bacterium]